MRTVEVLQILATAVGGVCTAIAAVEQRLIKRLRRAKASSPETAVRIGPLRPPTRWALRRLRGAEAVGETDSGALFLDEQRLKALRRRRAKIAAILVPSALLVVLVLYLLD